MYGGTGISASGSGLRPAGGDLRGNASGQMKEKVPSGYKAGALQKFTPETMNLYNQLITHLGPDSQTSKLAMGDEETFNQIEAPAWRAFNRAQGAIGNRYSQLAPGAMSASRGSGFANRMNLHSQDFAERLQANRQALSSQALRDLFSMSNTLFGNQPFERTLTEKGPSKFEKGFDMFLKTADVASKFIP